MSWWRNYFGDDFFELHIDLFPEEKSRAEVGGMIELLGLPSGSRVLDVPCGWGRHTRLLQEAGYDVFGADISEPLMRRAERGSNAPGYAAADIRFLPFADHSFDAAVNVFTSLGLFLSDDQDLAALREIRRVLKPGALFLLESMHRDDVIAHYSEKDRWELPNGIQVRVRRRFDPITGISYERLQWRRGEERGRKQHALKLRTATEIDHLLRHAGFTDIEYFGDWDGTPFSHTTESLIAIAQSR